MKIKEVTSQHRNDYCAIMTCEHCAHECVDNYGYFDANYNLNVIPAMYCPGCGKNCSGVEQDHRVMTWPNCASGKVEDPDMVFDMELFGFGKDFVICTASGFGKPGAYGNGALSVWRGPKKGQAQ